MHRNLVTEWDPNRIKDRTPCVLGAVGSRRCGKSTSIAHLVYQMYGVFDLVICFVGSAACSPTLEAMMERHPKWDTRMFFSSWNQPLVDKLLEQQENLKKAGVDRQVLILMDDVILTGKATDQLAHMCMRGRHFNISVMMAAVSYTSISKRSRRSLDFLLVFSCPMQGDRKVLSWEYAQNSSTADWVMNNLEENQCLVFETSRKVQRLFVWKSQLLLPEDFRSVGAKSGLPVLSQCGTESALDRESEERWASHRRGTASSRNRTKFSGLAEEDATDEKAGVSLFGDNDNASSSPRGVEASTG